MNTGAPTLGVLGRGDNDLDGVSAHVSSKPPHLDRRDAPRPGSMLYAGDDEPTVPGMTVDFGQMLKRASERPPAPAKGIAVQVAEGLEFDDVTAVTGPPLGPEDEEAPNSGHMDFDLSDPALEDDGSDAVVAPVSVRPDAVFDLDSDRYEIED